MSSSPMGLLSGQPWWLQQGVGVAAVVLWLGMLAAAAVKLRQLGSDTSIAGHKREWSRKLVHIGTGAVVPLAWLFGIDRVIAIPAAAAVTIGAAINHRTRLLPAIEDVGRHSYGTIAYGASITLLLVLFWPTQADAVCAGVVVMALGDGLAGVIGSWIPSPSWSLFGHRKSVIGTTVMAATGLLVLLVMAAVSRALGAAPAPDWGPLVAIALIATLLEQLAWLGLDNLTVPIVCGWLWASWR
ncbi:MAG: dolichol kinase [Cyanobacteriota bacterium]|nr:dolichol kinase [Cyanobacteriota bacterium]